MFTKNTKEFNVEIKEAVPEFNINDYEDYLNSPEYKDEQMKQFYDNARQIKNLSSQNISILSGCSNPEMKKQLFEIVTNIYGEVLEADTEEHQLDDIIINALADDELKIYVANKNKDYFPSGKVFEQHRDNNQQKVLVKNKFLGKREMNTQKTANKTLKYAYNAKKGLDVKTRLLNVEKALIETQYVVNMLAISQMEMQEKIRENTISVEELQIKLGIFKQKFDHEGKQKLYVELITRGNLGSKYFSEQLGISQRTAKRWLLEFEDSGIDVGEVKKPKRNS